MEDQIITFETAILAKEKGFDIPTRLCYAGKDSIALPYNSGNDYYKNNHDYESAPTQSLLQRWLREKFDIIVLSLPALAMISSNGGRDGIITELEHELNPSKIYNTKNRAFTYRLYLKGKRSAEGRSGYGYTYEQALERGLQVALKKCVDWLKTKEFRKWYNR